MIDLLQNDFIILTTINQFFKLLFSLFSFIAVGDQMFWGCKILIVPKSNQIFPNLITFVEISLQFCPKKFC